MLWTIVPLETVWQQPEEAGLKVRPHKQGFVVVRAGRDGSETIERLIATDPALYLEPGLQPGLPPPDISDAAL